MRRRKVDKVGAEQRKREWIADYGKPRAQGRPKAKAKAKAEGPGPKAKAAVVAKSSAKVRCSKHG